MHGIIFSLFNKFVRENYGQVMTTRISRISGMGYKFHDARKSYPDEEFTALLDTACQELEQPRDELLERFGYYITPTLLEEHASLINENWSCIDFLERVDPIIHGAMRKPEIGASPPTLIADRVSENELTIEYRSGRSMDAMGVGIIKAVGKHYGHAVNVEELDAEEGRKVLKVTLTSV
ncbi:hypothetical protein FUAX_37700 [Fulvitalea axinellae]|uniref:Heme NO-binding domain-containing protein n=1 Tax=Fulvitalea axinellae TaxID=1182444 RepID=A0AAU9CM84_9BACT|nr:hypothetical protein FUAX_37700 [Fulvitalea axinellae]